METSQGPLEEHDSMSSEQEEKGEDEEQPKIVVTSRKKRREKRLKSQPKDVTALDASSAPRGICVADFLEARATELHNMTVAVSRQGGARRTFQTLPRHMRRRAMSHNIKRLPYRLREQAKKEVVDSEVKKTSRKARRKPAKLVDEFGRRSDKCHWLETHVWHAKRFKMVEHHGYKIAERCCDKGARATYRYLTTGCLLYDMSYYTCVELVGEQANIIAALSPLISAQTGLTPRARDFIDGSRSGDVMFYHSYGFPDKPIGPARFVWRGGCDNNRQLWLIVHPSVCNIVLEQLAANQLAKPVKISNLQNELVQFRLVGPRSNAVLTSVLSPVWDEPLGDLPLPLDSDLSAKKKLFAQFGQAEATGVPHRMVLGLTVKDFRLSTPVRKVNISASAVTDSSLMVTKGDVSSSLIWSKEVRKKVKDTMISDNELNKHHSAQLGDTSKETIQCSLVPVLLLHQTVNGEGVGWDIMVPAGWGKPLWISLVYNGARVVGLEEMKQCYLEKMCLHFPNDYPDTPVCHQLELANEQLLLTTYAKYPPDKRPNFGKLNSPSPFLPVWGEVVTQQPSSLVTGVKRSLEEQACSPKKKRLDSHSEAASSDSSKTCSFYVLRSLKCLKTLTALLSIVNDKPVDQDWETVTNKLDLSIVLQPHYHSLVAIFFTMHHRGNPTSRSMLCLPTEEDLLSDDEPSESLNKKGVCLVQSEKLITGTTSLSKRHFKMVKKQATPDYDVQSVIPSRRVLGYATSAGYLYSRGVAGGVALCSLSSLVEVMKNCFQLGQPATLLVREHNSQQYRCATFTILL